MTLQYYRLERVSSGPIAVGEGEAQHLKPPSDVGTRTAQDERAPLSEIIAVLNERFGTEFVEEDRLFFVQIKARACRHDRVVQAAVANPLDKFALGIRSLIEELVIDRMGENDRIVTRYVSGKAFQGSAFPILAREIFAAVRARQAAETPGTAPDAVIR